MLGRADGTFKVYMIKEQIKMSAPFIGAVISLISKAEVRYEGILFNIDPVKSTVALQNGRAPFVIAQCVCHSVPLNDIFIAPIFLASTHT